MSKNKVMQSIEAPGGALCVDLYRRPDGQWGFAEFRRDPEDGSGWHPTGGPAQEPFASEAEAVAAALAVVPWLGVVL